MALFGEINRGFQESNARATVASQVSGAVKKVIKEYGMMRAILKPNSLFADGSQSSSLKPYSPVIKSQFENLHFIKLLRADLSKFGGGLNSFPTKE